MRRWLIVGALAVVLVLGLMACSGDDDEKQAAAPTPTAETTAPAETPAAGVPNLSGPGPALGGEAPTVGSGTQLPGCSDPNSEECPMPLEMDLDGTATANGVSIQYPTRYFDVQSGEQAPEGSLMAIVPSENNVYEQKAVFQVYEADSVDAALAELGENAEIVDWSTGALGAGKLGVSKDETQDPPVNETIGAFPQRDHAIVLRLTTTGKYGWDLWSQVYNAMLNTLTVTG